MFSIRTRGVTASFCIGVLPGTSRWAWLTGLLKDSPVFPDVRLCHDRHRHGDVFLDRLLVDELYRGIQCGTAFAFRVLLDHGGDKACIDALDRLRAQVPTDNLPA